MKLLVLTWPGKTAVLFERRLGRVHPIESLSGPIASLPDTWRARIDEVRVVVEAGILHRTLDLEGLSGSTLEEAARYAIEPGLPLPLGEAAIALLPPRGRNVARQAVVLPRRELDAIEAWLESSLRPSLPAGASIPIAWIGPFSALLDPADGARRGECWIADFQGGAPPKSAILGAGGRAGASVLGGDRMSQIAEGTACHPDAASRLLQCARSSAEIDELARSRGLDPAAIDRIEPADLAERAARPAAARLPGNWIQPRRRLAPILRNWPAVAAGLALLLFAAAFGLKSLTLDARSRAAEAAVVEAFTKALPGTRAVAPGEQIASRLKAARARHEILRDRLMKRGSALEILMLIEEATPPDEILLDDLRIGADEIVLAGSTRSIEALQRMKQAIETPREGRPRIRLAEPETRRSPAGLGLDFNLRGNR